MKKRLLFAAVALLTSMSVSAQCTADPQYTTPGVYPDSATGLPAACIDLPYAETITLIVPVDTTTVIFGIPFTLPFDSVVVSDWTGLPPGFTYACSSPDNTQSPVDNCSFEGGQTGCILISGNPVFADIGSYQQIITTDAYLQGNPNGNPSVVIVDYYYIQVVDCGLSVPGLTNSKFLVYPNPAKSVITLNGLNGIDVESISVTDMDGKVLESYENVIGPAL
ncbi:MAG: T9SS type A sorting domain-containing protein, partial [Crocinitomicaceae bacterium]|nr:T9SS type A sorting domain-containing protein [Crocinitomicaceae bacterium]